MGRLISIIGNSGSGKTTLARRLEETGQFTVFFEQHTERPFQAAFARDARYGLVNQIDYLLYRAEQERVIREQPGVCIQDGGLDLDFHVFTALFHRRGYLSEDEFGLCERLYCMLRAAMPAPEVFICLTAPLPVMAQRKASRGRALDISVTADLEVMEELLQTMRDAMIRQSPPPRWITLDTGTEDIQYGSTVDQLLRILEQPVSR